MRQGCVISPILFLVAIDWVMRNTISDKSRGIQWTLFNILEDLDFADDIALLSSKQVHMQEKTTRLCHYASQLGLQINTKKTEELRINTPLTNPIKINGENLNAVQDFTYLGGVVSHENPTQKDIKNRLNKARVAFQGLRHLWRSKQYSHTTKIRLYNSNVKSVLLYGSECWRVTQSDMNSLSAFHNNCLRRICNIFWPQKF